VGVEIACTFFLSSSTCYLSQATTIFNSGYTSSQCHISFEHATVESFALTARITTTRNKQVSPIRQHVHEISAVSKLLIVFDVMLSNFR